VDGTAEPASAAPEPSSPEETPEQANAELLRRGAALAELGDDDEIERLAGIVDQGDEEVAEQTMPDSEGWTAEERAERIEVSRQGRRWTARFAMRPGETADEWHERCVAQMVAEHGCAPLVIPARRREEVLEIDLAKVRRRDRKRLYKPGGFKSLHHARRHVLRALRVGRPAARSTPAPRPAALRPRRSSSSSRTSGADPGGGDSDDGPPPRRPARYSYAALTAAERRAKAEATA
jgi:hypothetical protein